MMNGVFDHAEGPAISTYADDSSLTFADNNLNA